MSMHIFFTEREKTDLNHASLLVPTGGGIFRTCPETWADLLHDWLQDLGLVWSPAKVGPYWEKLCPVS